MSSTDFWNCTIHCRYVIILWEGVQITWTNEGEWGTLGKNSKFALTLKSQKTQKHGEITSLNYILKL